MVPLRVQIKREPFSDFFDLYLENGHTEELEPDELREWFRIRGANMEKVEKVFDYCWNFPKLQTIVIANPRPLPKAPLDPILNDMTTQVP